MTHNYVWPERLMIRDTELFDDMGGLGQRIYTTAGAGYEKREYVRADIAADDLARLRAECEALRADAERYRWLRKNSHHLDRIGFVHNFRFNGLDAAIDAARKGGEG